MKSINWLNDYKHKKKKHYWALFFLLMISIGVYFGFDHKKQVHRHKIQHFKKTKVVVQPISYPQLLVKITEKLPLNTWIDKIKISPDNIQITGGTLHTITIFSLRHQLIKQLKSYSIALFHLDKQQFTLIFDHHHPYSIKENVYSVLENEINANHVELISLKDSSGNIMLHFYATYLAAMHFYQLVTQPCKTISMDRIQNSPLININIQCGEF